MIIEAQQIQPNKENHSNRNHNIIKIIKITMTIITVVTMLIIKREMLDKFMYMIKVMHKIKVKNKYPHKLGDTKKGMRKIKWSDKVSKKQTIKMTPNKHNWANKIVFQTKAQIILIVQISKIDKIVIMIDNKKIKVHWWAMKAKI